MGDFRPLRPPSARCPLPPGPEPVEGLPAGLTPASLLITSFLASLAFSLFLPFPPLPSHGVRVLFDIQQKRATHLGNLRFQRFGRFFLGDFAGRWRLPQRWPTEEAGRQSLRQIEQITACEELVATTVGLSRTHRQKNWFGVTPLTYTQSHFFCGCQWHVRTTSGPESVFQDRRVSFASCRKEEQSWWEGI